MSSFSEDLTLEWLQLNVLWMNIDQSFPSSIADESRSFCWLQKPALRAAELQGYGKISLSLLLLILLQTTVNLWKAFKVFFSTNWLKHAEQSRASKSWRRNVAKLKRVGELGQAYQTGDLEKILSIFRRVAILRRQRSPGEGRSSMHYIGSVNFHLSFIFQAGWPVPAADLDCTSSSSRRSGNYILVQLLLKVEHP